jgi:hypothetical protein
VNQRRQQVAAASTSDRASQSSSESTLAAADPVATCRVVLLGASNLTLGGSTVVETVRNTYRQPVDIFIADGLGRSYGTESRVLGRSLPAILHCGLWETLVQKPQTPTAALVTDIGNDILYGAEVPQILEWVRTVVGRLQQSGAKVCLTLLPLIEPADLSVARFRFFRTLFFPGCRLQRDEVLQRAGALHESLRQLGVSSGIQVIEQRRDWFGLDPIHIHRRHRPHAWREILSGWSDETAQTAPLARHLLPRWMYLQTRRPHRRRIFGFEQRARQPVVKLRDGTTVSFF